MKTATLTFPNSEQAKAFARAHSFKWLQGNDMSSVNPDGSRQVVVYDVTSEKEQWINEYVKKAQSASDGDTPESIIAKQQERIDRLTNELIAIYENAADSPEWIRARINAVMGRDESKDDFFCNINKCQDAAGCGYAGRCQIPPPIKSRNPRNRDGISGLDMRLCDEGGFVLVRCDESWGGTYGWTTKDSNCSVCGYKTEKAARDGFISSAAGGRLGAVMLKMLRELHKPNQ